MADGRKGKLFNNAHQSPQPRTDDAQHLERDLWVRQAERLKVLLADEENSCVVDGTRRCRVISAIEYRQFRLGSAGAFDAKNVFSSASGTFEDPQATGFDHVKATAGFPFGKNNLSPRETASNGPLCQEGKFSFAESSKNRDRVRVSFRFGFVSVTPHIVANRWVIRRPVDRLENPQHRCRCLYLYGQGNVILWRIRAAGFLGHRISIHGKRPRSRSSTNVAEFAGSALPAQLIGISELFEDWRISVDITETFSPRASPGNGKEAAGIDFAGVRDEDESLSIVQSARCSPNTVCHFGRGHRGRLYLFFHSLLLQYIPAVVLRFGCFYMEIGTFGKAEELCKDALELFVVQQLSELPPSRGHQEENAPQCDLLFLK